MSFCTGLVCDHVTPTCCNVDSSGSNSYPNCTKKYVFLPVIHFFNQNFTDLHVFGQYGRIRGNPSGGSIFYNTLFNM
jgi:hypothetical protein